MFTLDVKKTRMPTETALNKGNGHCQFVKQGLFTKARLPPKYPNSG